MEGPITRKTAHRLLKLWHVSRFTNPPERLWFSQAFVETANIAIRPTRGTDLNEHELQTVPTQDLELMFLLTLTWESPIRGFPGLI